MPSYKSSYCHKIELRSVKYIYSILQSLRDYVNIKIIGSLTSKIFFVPQWVWQSTKILFTYPQNIIKKLHTKNPWPTSEILKIEEDFDKPLNLVIYI